MIKKRPAPYSAINWVDLYNIREDKKVLKNPHKGWYWHYIDNGYKRASYRDPSIHKPDDYVEDFPGLNHLYLRIDWSDIEQVKDVYDWSYIDSIINEWSPKGYKFTFRVCSYEASPKLPYAAPEWLRELGCGGTEITFEREGGFAWEPDYGDPIFIERLDIFTKQFAEKFDGHPLIEYVDWGTYGTWGEGHTGGGTKKMWPVEDLKKHIDIYMKYFRNTPVLMNDDIVSTRTKDSDENKWELLNYCRIKGMGIRDDSVCVEGPALKNGYDSLRGAWLYDLFWENAPVDLEYEHFRGIKSEIMRDGFPLLDALEKTHATYAGFHGYPRIWLEQHQYLTEYLANKLGYWYFIEGLDIPEKVVTNTPFCFDIYWLNRGFAHSYNRFNIRILLENKESGYKYEQELADIDNRKWMPKEIAKERVKVDLKDLPVGKYELKLLMYESDTVIKLGIKDEYIDEKGYISLTNINIV